MSTATIGVTDIDATYYLVKDLDRATEFYTKLLGGAPAMTFPDMVAEWTFPSGASFGVYKPHEEEWRKSGGVLFSVRDLAGAVEAAKAAGVKFDDDGKIEETPVCLMAFGEDSEGNTFVLHQPKG
ncbi:MAG TPA: VOC family protein [Candidatus Tumulicola sp.]|jgi:predicted enzyme related to lactoylglutathione lyase